MGNSESTCSQHEDGCKEAMTKLEECARAHLASKEEIASKELMEGFIAVYKDDYMEKGACQESFLTFIKSTNKDFHDKDFHDKHMTMMECMEAHSDYYHTFLDFYKGAQEKLMSISPLRDECPVRAQEFLGDCCKEQYSAYLKCSMKQQI